jgi:hypothetical protein
MSNYPKIKFCASCVMVLVLFYVLGCTPEEPKGMLVSRSATSYSKINGKRFVFEISNEAIENSPAWSADKTIPLTTSEAVKIAELEVPNYSKEKDLWYVANVELNRFGLSDKWVYVVVFNKRKGSNTDMSTDDYLRIPVLFNGQPIKGK